MCYPSPGPRCSAHAKRDFRAANEKLKEAIESGSFHQYETARKASESAREAWLRTPEGMRYLRDHGDVALADYYKLERDDALAAMKAQNEAHTAAGENPSYELFDRNKLRSSDDPEYITRATRSMIEHDDVDMRIQLYGNPNFSEDHVNLLIDEAPQMVTRNLALKTSLSEETVMKMAERCPQVHTAVAIHANATAETLDLVQRTGNLDARRIVVRRSIATQEMLARGAADEDASIREDVAQNQNLGADLQDILARDSNVYVRQALVGNQPTLKESTLAVLSKDVNQPVRSAVSRHANTSDVTLREMARNDIDQSVREAAKANLFERTDALFDRLGSSINASLDGEGARRMNQAILDGGDSFHLPQS